MTSPLYEAFDAAKRLAEKHGLPGYSEWRGEKQRQYNVLPAAYFDAVECKRWYTDDILNRAASRTENMR